MGSATGKANRKLGYEDAMAELAVLKPKLDAAAAALAARSAELAGLAGEVKRLRKRCEQLRPIVDRGPGREAAERGRVENPLRAGDLVAGQLEDGTASELIEQGKFAGLVEVDIRLSTRIGGLSRIKERTEWQTLAAARFRSLWDQAQIGGARAIDYERVRVDTSGSSVDVVTSMGEDARRHYAEAVQKLGMVQANLVQRVVCEDMSLRALARKLGRADGFRARESLKQEVLDAMNVLVRAFHLGPARGRGRVRSDVAKATDWGAGQAEDGEECERAA